MLNIGTAWMIVSHVILVATIGNTFMIGVALVLLYKQYQKKWVLILGLASTFKGVMLAIIYAIHVLLARGIITEELYLTILLGTIYVPWLTAVLLVGLALLLRTISGKPNLGTLRTIAWALIIALLMLVVTALMVMALGFFVPSPAPTEPFPYT